MTDALIERVARALTTAEGHNESLALNDYDFTRARAAILAVLDHFSEPENVTDGMVSEHSAWDAVPSKPMPSMQSVWDNDTRHRVAAALRAARDEVSRG